MDTIYILNIPNFYASYYLYGLNKEFKVKFKMDDRFLKYNNRPFLIFSLNNKIAVINNDDPVYFDQKLYDLSDAFFVTNKLLDNPSFQQEKVKPLFPHYPINIVPLYLKFFNFSLFKYLKFKSIIKELYILKSRPVYKDYNLKIEKDNYIFFSSSIWKKEKETNTIRAEFIRYCKADERITFEGGFIPRSDGENLNFSAELNHIKYPPNTFSKLSKKSKIVLNNAAVWGAVSWRLAEYLNQSLFILSFPFKIELPLPLKHEEEIYSINDKSEFKMLFDKVLNNPDYHKKIAKRGKDYFSKYCTPSAQAKYIVTTLLN
ncbi:hypothetical protein [Algibacter sp. R77976]|uniref:hypothetical protein n=1 Tax=Algibacter sp. R77976 TaxID=3093873 RepID=UPI0037CC67F9